MINPKNIPKPETIPEALARFAHSDRIALRCGDELLSYRQLLTDARYVAYALMERGVQKGDRVALELSRGTAYVQVYLGVIFAGGVAVTIHSGWPEQQRAQVYSDCTPVLTVDDVLARELLHTHRNAGEDACPLPALAGGDPFQIVYTSGSTGAPKGVVNCHQLAINTLMAGTEATERAVPLNVFTQCHCMLADINLAYAVTGGQLLISFLNGKTAVMALEEELKTPDALAGCMRRQEVDALLGIPSRYYSYMVHPDFAAALSGMRLIILSGERADEKVLDAILEASGAEIRYAYSSSEVFYSMDYPYRKGADALYETPLRALPIYLLEQNGYDIVPDGIPGEICIGGAAGQYGRYWNNPELTEKQYLVHPQFGRLFRTGDLAQRTADGRIRIVGRLDGMAKLHGQRIEIGAIEAAMEAFPGIRRAAVKIQGEGSEATLCGYYSGSVDQGALRRHLAEVLPYYMVPALLRELPELPVISINGKLDRRALPPIQRETGGYAPPETKAEELLCEVIAQVIKPEAPVGIDDSFFELGGDSIRGMAAAALLRERGYEMKMEWLFAAPTVRMLAPMLLPLAAEEETDMPLWSAELSEADWACIDASVGREKVETVYPVLFHAKEHLCRNDLWMLPEIRVIHRDLSADEIQEKLMRLQRCFTALRSVFVGAGTARPLQVVLKQATLSFFHTDLRSLSSGNEGTLSARQEDYLRTLISLQRQAELNASREVPFRLGLIRVSENTCVVFCFFSHLLLDAAGIAQVMEGLLGPAQPKPDTALFDRTVRRLCTEDKTEARRYWQTVTGAEERFTRLPSGEGPTSFLHDEALSDALLLQKARRFCAGRNLTLSALLHLAAGQTLMELLELPQVSFASTSFGRDAETARLAGMFMNHFPILIRRDDTLETVQEKIFAGMKAACLSTEELPTGFGLPGMAGAFKLNVENAGNTEGEEYLPQLMRGDMRFALRETAAGAPPHGIDGELTLMVSMNGQFYLDFYYSPAYISRAFVKRFGAALLGTLRRLVQE